MLVKSNVDTSIPDSKEVQATNAVKAGLSFSLFLLIGQNIVSTPWLTSPLVAVTDSVSVIGRHIFSDFLLPFELVSILLLVALVGASSFFLALVYDELQKPAKRSASKIETGGNKKNERVVLLTNAIHSSKSIALFISVSISRNNSCTVVSLGST